MSSGIDHGLYARQIALAEVGVAGQRRLAEASVSFVGCPSDVGVVYARAGGRSVASDGVVSVTLIERHVTEGPESVGLSAWCAVEASRRVLSQPSVVPSAELLKRLGAT